MKKLFLLLFIPFCIVAACKKSNDDPKPANAERKALLTGTWKLTAMTYSPPYDYDQNGTPETDAYAVMEPCQKDDLLTLRANGTWESDPGIPCDWEDPDDFSGQWKLSDDGKTFTEGDEEGTILQLDEHIFKFQVSVSDDGVTYTVTITWTRQ
ncbi:MAG: lipocalin family protein [Chitinophagaceae bacterium]|nr:lipocalin family protein [Chitinophagaceae bacterium]